MNKSMREEKILLKNFNYSRKVNVLRQPIKGDAKIYTHRTKILT